MSRRLSKQTSQEFAVCAEGRALRIRALGLMLSVAAAFGAVSLQLIRLAATAQPEITISKAEAAPQSFARPDIIDRSGRLIATDVAMPSVYADPFHVLNRDQFVERVASVLPETDMRGLRQSLGEPGRRFVWVRRGLSPKLAQQVHNLGLPGLAFKTELRRAYPMGRLAGYVLGNVDVDNKGIAGIEHHIDAAIGVEGVHGATLTSRGPVRIALDTGVQHSVEHELDTAMRRFRSKAAAGLVMNIDTGEVLASASLPSIDPLSSSAGGDEVHIDRISGGSYELGSVMKMVTLAMVLDGGSWDLSSLVDVTQPLKSGRYEIKDAHPSRRPLTVEEVFTRSSNVGAALLALEVGRDRQKDFLTRLGLLDAMRTERGPVASPQMPQLFGEAEQITMAYGHGLAIAPLQFAAAAASLINGGTRVAPTFMAATAGSVRQGERVVSPATSKRIQDLMRLNVVAGTGKRAAVPGYEVGGKTGTAEMARKGGYAEKSVIASFVAAFPMSKPQYLVFVSLFEPHATPDTAGEVTAGRNAAPTAGRIIARIAPQLGVLPAGPSVVGAAE